MEILMQNQLLKASCLILPLCCASTAMAELATYEISATIYDVYDPANVIEGNDPSVVTRQLTGNNLFK
jgi:hypothetical protein